MPKHSEIFQNIPKYSKHPEKFFSGLRESGPVGPFQDGSAVQLTGQGGDPAGAEAPQEEAPNGQGARHLACALDMKLSPPGLHEANTKTKFQSDTTQLS